jgi:predicted ferric reductase
MSALSQSAALWYASRATGIVAVVLLSLVVILGVLVSSKARLPGLPRFAVVALHRRVCLIAVLFVTVHVLTAVADSYVSIRLAAVVIPFTSAWLCGVSRGTNTKLPGPAVQVSSPQVPESSPAST